MAELTPERWRLVAAILDDALELQAAEQAAYLERTCGGDERLRSEVEALLAADADSGGFLELPAAEYLTSIVGDGRKDLPDDSFGNGARVGPFRVVREIARGGMGEVYLAERADGQFDQQVALKLVRSGMASAEVHRRFLAERQ